MPSGLPQQDKKYSIYDKNDLASFSNRMKNTKVYISSCVALMDDDAIFRL